MQRSRRRAFLAHKAEGEPGANTIWEGLQRVIIPAETLRALRGEAT
ncbi:IS4 family transposase [Pandoraea sp. NE5]